MVCGLTVSDEVVKDAWPEDNGTVARTLLPSMNVTIPVGVPAPGATAVTFARRVTARPR